MFLQNTKNATGGISHYNMLVGGVLSFSVCDILKWLVTSPLEFDVGCNSPLKDAFNVKYGPVDIVIIGNETSH